MRIPQEELNWRFSRSSGAGGQNVNKVETKVELRYHPAASRALTHEQRQTVLQRLAEQLAPDGTIRVIVSTHRSQSQNRDEALVRLEQLLDTALRPRRTRRPTRVPRSVREQRLQEKRRRSAVKSERRYTGAE